MKSLISSVSCPVWLVGGWKASKFFFLWRRMIVWGRVESATGVWRQLRTSPNLGHLGSQPHEFATDGATEHVQFALATVTSHFFFKERNHHHHHIRPECFM